jgi:transaldolase
MGKSRLYELARLGQEVWHDDLYRSLITSGKLQRMVKEDGLSGVTSNPTIFDKAISSSSDYDDDIQRLKKEGKSSEEIVISLMIKDVQMAADVLRPVYEESRGEKGYVSLEVSPLLAYDEEKTVSEAKRLIDLVNRENVMIKVPGTDAGVNAFRRLVEEGCNINVTLLFSLNHYKRVALAYVEGLSRRVEKGLELSGIASVASFFLSRIDTQVDKKLDELIKEGIAEAKSLRGQTAISIAHLVYESFLSIFNSSFSRLRKKGARVQKPLWASSSTKDPSYSDVKYPQALIFSQTVVTLPMVTMEAFRKRGRVKETSLQAEKARQVLKQLKEFKIDVDVVCDELQMKGVEAFKESYFHLVETVKGKQFN